jgi:hypothetical protein
VAPASIAFSISSFTADAGRSITSPAAILLMISSDKNVNFSRFHAPNIAFWGCYSYIFAKLNVQKG